VGVEVAHQVLPDRIGVDVNIEMSERGGGCRSRGEYLRGLGFGVGEGTNVGVGVGTAIGVGVAVGAVWTVAEEGSWVGAGVTVGGGDGVKGADVGVGSLPQAVSKTARSNRTGASSRIALLDSPR